jgi:hypothetical protein
MDDLKKTCEIQSDIPPTNWLAKELPNLYIGYRKVVGETVFEVTALRNGLPTWSVVDDDASDQKG